MKYLYSRKNEMLTCGNLTFTISVNILSKEFTNCPLTCFFPTESHPLEMSSFRVNQTVLIMSLQCNCQYSKTSSGPPPKKMLTRHMSYKSVPGYKVVKQTLRMVWEVVLNLQA